MPRQRYFVVAVTGTCAPVEICVPLADDSLVSALLEAVGTRAARMAEIGVQTFVRLALQSASGPVLDPEDCLCDVVDAGEKLFALTQNALAVPAPAPAAPDAVPAPVVPAPLTVVPDVAADGEGLTINVTTVDDAVKGAALPISLGRVSLGELLLYPSLTPRMRLTAPAPVPAARCASRPDQAHDRRQTGSHVHSGRRRGRAACLRCEPWACQRPGAAFWGR